MQAVNRHEAIAIPAGRGVSARTYALEETIWPIYSEKRSASLRDVSYFFLLLTSPMSLISKFGEDIFAF